MAHALPSPEFDKNSALPADLSRKESQLEVVCCAVCRSAAKTQLVEMRRGCEGNQLTFRCLSVRIRSIDSL